MLIYILLKKLWENIPPHVNMCITGAICVAHRDRQGFTMLVVPGAGPGHCCLPGGRVQQLLPHSLASSSRVAMPLRPHGAGLLAGHTAPCRAWQSPAPEGRPRGIGVMKECPGVSERGLERRERCFLALELHSWPLPTAIPVSASGEAPVPVLSCPMDGGVWLCRRGREHRHPGLF